MSAALAAENRQRGGDAVEHALDVDVDRVFPLFDPQVIERGQGADAGVADEHVQPPEAFAGQLDQGKEIVAPAHVGL